MFSLHDECFMLCSLDLNVLYTEFIKMADVRKRSGVSYPQHGVEAF